MVYGQKESKAHEVDGKWWFLTRNFLTYTFCYCGYAINSLHFLHVAFEVTIGRVAYPLNHRPPAFLLGL